MVPRRNTKGWEFIEKRQNTGTKEPGTQEESAKVEDFLVTAVHLLANFLSSSAFEGRKQLW